MDKKIKVLMVDDEVQFRKTTKKILTKKGFDTLMAANGEEALAQLANDPDVVVLDIRMPGMDGNETLAEIKRQKPEIPVIMLTGHGEGEAAKRSLAQGAFDFLSKPCDIDTLALRIVDACQQPAADETEEAERRVQDVMIPVEEYTKLLESQTVAEGIKELKRTFSPQLHTSSIMETGHRSLLVFDAGGNLTGILAITDLLEAVMPSYLSAPKPSTADSLQYSPMFWTGMFVREVSQMAATPVGELMSPTPPSIDADANLMEAAYLMVTNQCRRMVVLEQGRVVGVIREQDLFFEMERVLR
ncbi:MAG: response regulator [Desulfosarcina sp.]|nr:response regulator [Desulfosarcina sp.]MBC2765999.1 response regulator [Desulfosarcina sp.]